MAATALPDRTLPLTLETNKPVGNSKISLDNAEPWPRVPFGKEMFKQFILRDGYIALNHGSFGTFPRVVRDVVRYHQDLCEEFPDVHCRYEFPKYLNASRKALAETVNCDIDDLVIVANATTGVNTVLRNLVFEKGDVIIIFSTMYGACSKSVEFIVETTPADVVVIPLTYPVSNADVLKKFTDAVQEIRGKGQKAKLACFDTISSMPGVRMPFEDLVAVCHKEGILSLIDGAHGIGQIPLDLGKLDPDFFTSNVHKWFFTPRGMAFLYVSRKNQSLMRSSLPTSHGFVPAPSERVTWNPLPEGTGSPFIANFEFVGSFDTSIYASAPTAKRFRDEVCGGERQIWEYCTSLAKEGAEIIALKLGTDVMDTPDAEGEQATAIRNIRLPFEIGKDLEMKEIGAVCDVLARRLAAKNTFLGIYAHAGWLWARLSAQIYLDVDDMKAGAEILKDVVDTYKAERAAA